MAGRVGAQLAIIGDEQAQAVLRPSGEFQAEHGGADSRPGDRLYFADWKSDRLASFEDAAIREHVEGHYEIQEKLYSLALVKLLDIRTEADFEARFGGLVYLFLRGMKIDEQGRAGIYTWRPSWADLLRWEEELRNNETWTVQPQRAA